MFRYDGDVMESLDLEGGFEGSKHTPGSQLASLSGNREKKCHWKAGCADAGPVCSALWNLQAGVDL